jgi:hypothetical protein
MVSFISSTPASTRFQLIIPSAPIPLCQFTLPVPARYPNYAVPQRIPHYTVAYNPDADGGHPVNATSDIRSRRKSCVVQRYLLFGRPPQSFRYRNPHWSSAHRRSSAAEVDTNCGPYPSYYRLSPAPAKPDPTARRRGYLPSRNFRIDWRFP